MRRAIFAFIACVSLSSWADEGLWTFDRFPHDTFRQRYQQDVSTETLTRLKESTIRLNGCSGALISPAGLIAVPQNCVRGCLAQVATQRREATAIGRACQNKALRATFPLFDLLVCNAIERSAQYNFVEAGYVAKTKQEELKCQNLVAERLIETTDVTLRLRSRSDDETSDQSETRLKEERIRIQGECGDSTRYRCDEVWLYKGARVYSYKYELFRDVRLVLVPEDGVAHFGGGDFERSFPQFAFPIAMARIYLDGRPLRPLQYLEFSSTPAKEGDVLVMSGHPASTSRRALDGYLKMRRFRNDFILPWVKEMQGSLRVLEATNAGQRARRKQMDERFERIAGELFDERTALDEGLERTGANLDVLTAKREEHVALAMRYRSTVNEANLLFDQFQRSPHGVNALEFMNRGSSALSTFAQFMVRVVVEKEKPESQRLEGYSDAEIAETIDRFLKPIEYDEAIEATVFASTLRTLRQWRGPNDPLVRKVLNGQNPESIAEKLFRGTRFKSVAARRALWEGGQAAVDASRDPMIEFARLIEPDNRAASEWNEQLNAKLESLVRTIGTLEYQMHGDSIYPEGGGDLRVRFGPMRGLVLNGVSIPASTPLSGMYGLARSAAPNRLPDRWMQAKDHVDLHATLNFSAALDAVFAWDSPDDSGAPIVNLNGTLVGFAFDGNEGTRAARFRYSEDTTRAVVVDAVTMLQLIRTVYQSHALSDELQARLPTSGK